MIRDIRKMRKNNTITLSMTTKDIGSSSKDLKKARSSQQINLKGFSDSKNQKIKNIDHRLELHQNEIQKNNGIIEELTQHLVAIKDQLTVEKQRISIEQKKTKGLREQIERTNKILRSKNNRIDEISRKLENSEKQNEGLKNLPLKIEELTKVNNQLRKHTSLLEEQAAQKKLLLTEKQSEIAKLREKVKDLGCTKAQYDKIQALLQEREKQINHLKSEVLSFSNEQRLQSHTHEKQMKKMFESNRQLNDSLKTAQKELSNKQSIIVELNSKILKLQIDQKGLQTSLLSKTEIEQSLRKKLQAVEKKLSDSEMKLLSYESEQNKKLEELANKYKNSLKNQHSFQQNLKKQNLKLQGLCDKFETLKKQSINMEGLYNSMLPQIQCPYGHQLKNPVTVIPCGHNYCLNCKKGYQKECSQCSGKLKIEAVYRNELMDDIINIVSGIRKIIEIVK